MGSCQFVERVTGIEPAFSAWEADVLPLNYTRETVVESTNPKPSWFQPVCSVGRFCPALDSVLRCDPV